MLDPELLGVRLDLRQEVLGVLVHPHHPLALERQQVGRAHRVHAHEARACPSGRSGKWRRPKACMPSMNDSSDPVDSRITRSPSGGRLVAQRARASDSSTATPVRLSLAPGTTAARADVRHRRRVARRRGRSRRGAARAAQAASRRPPPAARRPRPTWSPAWCRPRRGPSGSGAAAPAASSGWNTRPEWAASWWDTTTTVRSASSGPSLGHDVRGGSRGQQGAPKPLAPAGDVVGHGRRREQARRHARRAVPGRRRPGPRRPVRMPTGHQ